MRPLLLGLLVLTLLGIGAWILLESTPELTTTSNGSLEKAWGSADALQLDDSTDPHASRNDSMKMQRDSLDLSVATSEHEEGHDFHLIVVDPKDLTPLPGAEVFLQRDPNLNRIWDYGQRDPIPAVPLITSGDGILGPFLADANGTVYLPTPDKNDLIIARHGESIGFRTQEGRERWQGEMLKVYLDRTLRVHAVDVDGNPVPDHPIGLYQGRSQLKIELVATTDSEGIARFHTPRFFLRGQTAVDFYLGALGHGTTPDAGPFSFANIPHDTEVVVRPTGTWNAKMQYADGTPFDGFGWISLRSLDQTPHTMAYMDVPVEAGGVVSLTGLGPNVLFKIEASFEPCQAKLEFERTSPAGGQTEDLIFRLTQNVHRMQVELLDKGGEPFANQKATISIWGTNKQPVLLKQMRGVTDSTGKLNVAFLPLDDARLLRFGNRVLVAKLQVEENDLWFQGEVPFLERLFDQAAPATFVLESMPVLAGGIVVDSLGAPVIGLPIRAQEAGNSWPDVYVRGMTDTQGRFILQGNPPPKEAELKVSPKSQTIPPVPLDVGSLEHRIEIEATPFQIKGRILFPDNLRHTSYGTNVFFQQGDKRYFIDDDNSQGIADFDLAVSSQVPGRLVLQLRGFGEIATLDEIVPATPDSLQDSRILPWDLRQIIALAEVEVFLGSVRVKDFQIDVEEKGERAGRFQQIRVFTENGRRFMLPQGLPLQVRLTGKGLRATNIAIKPGKQIIQGRPAIHGNFLITGDGIVPVGFRLSFSGRPMRNTGFQRRFRANSPPEWNIDFQAPGPWTCRLTLEEVQNGETVRSAKISFNADFGERLEVVVPEDSDTFTVEIPLPQRAIDQALSAIRAKSND